MQQTILAAFDPSIPQGGRNVHLRLKAYPKRTITFWSARSSSGGTRRFWVSTKPRSKDCY